MHYVVGFVFRNDFSEVALIEKRDKPVYMIGLLNGIGGGVERGETAAAAIVREVQEESGLLTREHQWRNFATLNTVRGDRIDCFVTRYQESMGELQTLTHEPVGWYGSELAQESCCWHNLAYLVPLAEKVAKCDIPRLTILEHGGL